MELKKNYQKFKHWVEQKSVQKVLSTSIISFLLVFVAVELVFANNDSHILSKVLGVTISKPTPTMAPTETPVPTEAPTDTPVPQEQTYQQPVQQVPTKINCNVTAYVPNYQPVYEPFTPQQCAFEQQYAVILWNRTVGAQQNTQLPMPQPVYNYPSGNANVPPPPAIGGQPVLQQPTAPNGSINYQPPVAPTSSCHWVCTSDSNCMQICN